MFRFKNCDNKPPPNVAQPNQVIVRRWATCAAGTEVIFVTLTDGGHTWPDASDHLGFDANAEVPKFFLRHTRP
jgi:poly(3-hydroxybutyrate) depolymerase